MAKIKINITLEEELMRRIDDYVDENYLNRSMFFSLVATEFLRSSEAVKAVKDIAFSIRKIADSGVVDDETRRQLDDFERLSKMLVM